MLHHWLQRDNKWAEILGLFEAYLWILRQIFPPLLCLFLWAAKNVRGWKEREQEMWERQKVGGLGFLQTLGSSSEYGRGLFLLLCSGWDPQPVPTAAVGSPGPQTHPGKIQEAWASLVPEGFGVGSLIQQQLGQDFWQSRDVPATKSRSQGCLEWGFHAAVKFTPV